MQECDIWKRETDEEFENSMEAMEKLVMNRIYDLYAFTLNCLTHLDTCLAVLSRLKSRHSDIKLRRMIWNGIKFSPNVFDCSHGSKRNTWTYLSARTTLDSLTLQCRVGFPLSDYTIPRNPLQSCSRSITTRLPATRLSVY